MSHSFQILDLIFSAIIGAAGVVISVLLYRLSCQRRRESWLKTFMDMHHEFWKEPDYAEVRSWLACDVAFKSIAPVLRKREKCPSEITDSEYKILEKLDKFLNFMARIVEVNPEFPRQGDVWERLFFEYWLKECAHKKRKELHWYLKRFYKDLIHKSGIEIDTKKE